MAESGLGQRALFRFFGAIIGLIFALAAPVVGADKSASPPGKYLGTGSCSATGCHGGNVPVQPRQKTGALLNEYTTWARFDPHFNSYYVLQNKTACGIIAILNGLEKSVCEKQEQPDQGKEQPLAWKPATNEPRCLACHALAPGPGKKDRDFGNEGVGCESCHGSSSGWFKPHFGPDWKTENCSKPEYGITCLRDAAIRSKTCLDCHLGTKDRQVDHKMIAAGHPDLFFELDLFSAKETPHWKKPDDSNYGVRLWAVGQVVQLQKALERLEYRAKNDQWPEFSELDCFSCHHGVNTNWRQPDDTDQALKSLLRAPESWRQDRGYPGRTAGSPPWNTAHYSILRILLDVIDADASSKLQEHFRSLNNIAGKLSSRANDVANEASKFAEFAAGLVDKVNKPFSKQMTARLLLNISGQGKAVANQDTRSAEQAYMALESIFRCYEKMVAGQPLESAPDKGVAMAIEALYHEFDNPSAFDAPRFATGMDKVHAELLAAHIGTQHSTYHARPSGNGGPVVGNRR